MMMFIDHYIFSFKALASNVRISIRNFFLEFSMSKFDPWIYVTRFIFYKKTTFDYFI